MDPTQFKGIKLEEQPELGRNRQEALPQTPENQTIRKVREEMILKLSYFMMMLKRWPFNDPEIKSSQPGEDIFTIAEELIFEQVCPNELSFTEVSKLIKNTEQKMQIETVWKELNDIHWTTNRLKDCILNKWGNTPDFAEDDTLAVNVLEVSPLRDQINAIYHKTALTLIVPGNRANESLGYWQLEEAGLRKLLFEEMRKFLILQRTYLELIIKALKNHRDNYSTTLRNQAIHMGRYSRLVSTGILGSTFARATHHQQPNAAKVRKNEEIAYMLHPLSVLGRYINDIIPYIIDTAEFNNRDMVVGLLASVLHDLVEDSALDSDEVVKAAAEIIDKKDSKVLQLINTAEKELNIHRSGLYILTPDRSKDLKLVLKALSKNTKLNRNQTKMALKANLHGRTETLRHTQELAEDENVYQRQINTTDYILADLPQSKTIQTYPTAHEKPNNAKLDKFLIKLITLNNDPSLIQIALTVKIEDRIDNLLNMEGMSAEYQLRNIRGAFTRLAAWAMLDHDRQNYPLHNALPNLLKTIICQYNRIIACTGFMPGATPETSIQNFDNEYLMQAKMWLRELYAETIANHKKSQ